MVGPSAKVLPEAGLQMASTEPSTMSLADAVKVTAAPFAPVDSAVMLAGRVRNGGVVSTMVTLKYPVAVFPWTSVDEQLTTVVPNAKVLPEAGLQNTASKPSTRSLADTLMLTTAPSGPVAS